MDITFLGGADEVGASCLLVEMGGKQILVDAGIRISPRSNRGIQNDQLPDLYPISERGGLDYILVTHAHTDHTGALPLLLEQYPHTPVMGTRPTIALTKILQADALRIMSSKEEQEGELPIFDEVASQRLMDAIQEIEFNQAIHLGEGLQVTYYPSGHIAGAATLVLEGEDGTLVISGDVSLSDQRTVVNMQIPRVKANALILESTYGGKLHANRVAEEKRLIAKLQEVTERGGMALIPAFALGRSQEVIQIILAYRDQFDAPVYVDGMVRSVCTAYHGFSDLLPKNTVKMAKDDHLFFRKNITKIKSSAHREEVARSGQPGVVVASSGMLTGGASVVYAKHLADDERNAIFLTGYQDEEAPGRFLQRLQRERQEGDTPTIRIGDDQVTVRCTVDTYSLSAHADESELVGVAESLDAERTMLVHGDPGARHSLATALRQRGRNVTTPKIGQTVSLTFPKRPWAIGRVQQGHETKPLDPQKLWEALKDRANNFFSAKELSLMWWGDANRHAEAAQVLEESVFFAADWRNKTTFKVRSEKDVKKILRRRAIMLANPDIVGKLIVLRNVNDQPRVGIVTDAQEETFEADVLDAAGKQHPADELLWVIGMWEGFGDANSRKAQLRAMVKAAEMHKDTLLPYSVRQEIVNDERVVKPEDLMPPEDAELPEGMTRQAALLSIVLALAGDGATVEQDGLKPERARKEGPMEQNQARELALSIFPEEAGLRKVGMEIHRRRLVLDFDYPKHVEKTYAEVIEQLTEQTGWTIYLKPGVNQQALAGAINDLMPDGGRISKGPSYYMDKEEVQIQVDGADEDALKAMQREFAKLTGFRLVTGAASAAGDGDNGATSAAPSSEATSNQLEINAAYGIIKVTLEPHGLYKAGLKNGQIVLSFISPQVGARCEAQIAELAEQTGYPLMVHPHPNQQMILEVVRQLLRDAGWQVSKGPGIHVDRGVISMKLVEEPEEAEVAAFAEKLERETGYTLEVGV